MSEMTCQELEDILDEWLAGELADTVLVIVDKHLGNCAHCGKQVALYKATVAVCRALPRTPEVLSDGFAARLRRLILLDE